MKNWMLVCCYERNIETPMFFNTKEEAVKAMCADVADVLGMTTDEVMEIRVNKNGEGDIDFIAHVGDDYAWSDRNVPGDWRIFNLIGRV